MSDHPTWGFMVTRFGRSDFTDNHDLAEWYEDKGYATVTIACWSFEGE